MCLVQAGVEGVVFGRQGGEGDMAKAAGIAAAMWLVGSVAMSMTEAWLGALAEPAGLAVMGLGCVTTARLFAGRFSIGTSAGATKTT